MKFNIMQLGNKGAKQVFKNLILSKNAQKYKTHQVCNQW